MAGLEYLHRHLNDPDPTRLAFLQQKQKEQQDYILDLKNGTNPTTQGKKWAQFAEAQIDNALTTAWHTCRQAHRFIKSHEFDPIPGMFILGLGKLGGNDLNFSSDIDIVAFYDPKILPIPETAGRTHICAEVLRDLIRLIDGHKSGAFAWRTDWRLRPDPSVTDLAMSTDAGIDYFYFQSAPWRRLALVKARVIAGDKTAGEAFLENLHAFIWRRHLDFSMVQEIAGLKSRIHLEHPELANSRRVSHNLKVQDRFNLKLGRGGIRDVEFVANALQLLWGGRYASLQQPHTQTALQELENLGFRKNDKNLNLAYSRMRTWENTVQAYEDRQTHLMPKTEAAQDWISQVCGVNFSELSDELAHHRMAVAQAFDSLFEHVSPTPSLPNLRHIKPLDLELNERNAMGLGSLLEVLDQVLSERSNVEADRLKLMHWLTRLKGKNAYLAALQDTPSLAALAFRSILDSPLVASLVSQTPLVIDSLFAHSDLISNLNVQKLIRRGQLQVNAAPMGEYRLGALRTWINESLYLTYLSTLSGELEVLHGNIILGQLAEGALDLCAKVVAEDLSISHLPFTIVAMGRLGLEHMAPGSDLDLIFVLDENIDLAEGNQAVARFMTAVNARMAEGRVYEIDTRLRPSGASGPPTLSFNTFAEHQLTRAKTWEHLALTFMRPLNGVYHSCTPQRQRLLTLKHEILSRKRNLPQCLKDIRVMLRRLQEQRIDQDGEAVGEVKLAAGGTMELEYLCAAQILTRPDLTGHSQALADLNLKETANIQSSALAYQRLLGAEWEQKHPTLAHRFRETQTHVRKLMLKILGDPSGYPSAAEWQEKQVDWSN